MQSWKDLSTNYKDFQAMLQNAFGLASYCPVLAATALEALPSDYFKEFVNKITNVPQVIKGLTTR